MIKVFITLKMILFLSLISMSLSFGVLVGSYTKSPLNTRDRRFNNVLSLTAKRAIEKNGGYENVKVYPIAAYRQIVNGVNYKIINVIKDDKNMKVDLVASDVYTGSMSKADSLDESFYSKEDDYFPHTYAVETESLLDDIADFLHEHLAAQNISIKNIHSVVSTIKIVNHESHYLVNTIVESEGKSYTKFFVIYQEEGKGFSVIDTIDFDAC